MISRVWFQEVLSCQLQWSRNILERHAKAIVVKKTRDNTDPGDLEDKLWGFGLLTDKKKLFRVFAIARGLLGGTSAVGRSKVDKKITAQEHNDVLMVLIHLEQSIRLQEEQEMKLVPIDMDYSTELVLIIRRLAAGWGKDWDKQILMKTKLEKDLDLLFILYYSQHYEVASRVTVKIVETEKKTLSKSMGEQVLGIKMVALVFVTKRQSEVNCKCEGTPMRF